MKKVKISSLLFWGYLLLIYIITVAGIANLFLKVKKYQKQISQQVKQEVQITQPDTLLLQAPAIIWLKKSTDSKIKYGTSIKYQITGKTMRLLDGSIMHIYLPKPPVIIVSNIKAQVTVDNFDNPKIIVNKAKGFINAKKVKKIQIDIKNSNIRLKTLFTDTVYITLKDSKLDISTNFIKYLNIEADSTSFIMLKPSKIKNYKITGGPIVQKK